MWIASWTSWRSARSSAQRICSGPAATSSWIFSPPPPARSAASTGSGRAEDARTSSAALTRVGLERRPRRREPLGRVGAEVPDRPEVLDHERGEAAGERRVGDLRREPVHVRVDAARRDDHAGRVDHRRRPCRARPRRRPSCPGCPRGRSPRCARRARRGSCCCTPSTGSATSPPTMASSTPPRSARTPSPSRIVLPKPGRIRSGPPASSASGTSQRSESASADARLRHRGTPARARAPARRPSRPSASSGPSASPAWPRITRSPPKGEQHDLARDARVEQDLRARLDGEPHAPGRARGRSAARG